MLEHKIIELPDGCLFEGWFCDGLRIGWGVKTYPNGAEYHGTYKDDVRHGPGIKIWADGTTRHVEYDNGKLLQK